MVSFLCCFCFVLWNRHWSWCYFVLRILQTGNRNKAIWATELNWTVVKGNAKECSNYCTIALISHASKVMLKILQVRDFISTWIVNFQMFKMFLEMAEEPGIKFPTSVGSSKKQQSSRKIFTSALLTMPKPSTVWITTNCEKFLKKWEY